MFAKSYRICSCPMKIDKIWSLMKLLVKGNWRVVSSVKYVKCQFRNVKVSHCVVVVLASRLKENDCNKSVFYFNFTTNKSNQNKFRDKLTYRIVHYLYYNHVVLTWLLWVLCSYFFFFLSTVFPVFIMIFVFLSHHFDLSTSLLKNNNSTLMNNQEIKHSSAAKLPGLSFHIKQTHLSYVVI